MSSTADVLGTIVVRGMRGVGGVCEMLYVFGRRRRGGEWMGGLGLGFTNPVGTEGVLDVCLWWCRWGLERGLEGWADVCMSWQVQVSVYCARRIPAHLRCTQCSILCTISISASHRVFVYGRYRKSRLVCIDITRFYEEQLQQIRLAGKKVVNRAPLLGREVSTQFAQQSVTAVRASPLAAPV